MKPLLTHGYHLSHSSSPTVDAWEPSVSTSLFLLCLKMVYTISFHNGIAHLDSLALSDQTFRPTTMSSNKFANVWAARHSENASNVLFLSHAVSNITKQSKIDF